MDNPSQERPFDANEATPEEVEDAIGSGEPDRTPLMDRISGDETASQTGPSEPSPEDQDAPPTGYDETVDDTFPASDPPAGSSST